MVRVIDAPLRVPEPVHKFRCGNPFRLELWQKFHFAIFQAPDGLALNIVARAFERLDERLIFRELNAAGGRRRNKCCVGAFQRREIVFENVELALAGCAFSHWDWVGLWRVVALRVGIVRAGVFKAVEVVVFL